MKSLNHPLKRFAFVLCVVCCASFVVMILLPEPFTVRRQSEWRDTNASEEPTRVVTRLDTSCAAENVGGIEQFANDYFVLLGLDNEYGRLLVFEALASSDGPIPIAEQIDLSPLDELKIRDQLADDENLCIRNVRYQLCVEMLSQQLFDSIVTGCGVEIGQVRESTVQGIRWRIRDNFENHSPWSWLSLGGSVLFLLLSLFYDRTVGRLVNWIRDG